jgi:hypothetical protein
MKILSHYNTVTRLPGFRLLLIASVIIAFSGCASNKYNSQKNWHRTPTSTSRNKCGCLLKPAELNPYKLNYTATYVFQA